MSTRNGLALVPPAPDDSTPVVTRGALRAAVWDIWIECLEVFASEVSRPALLNTAQLSRELQISDRTILTLRGEGLPVVMIGDSPRYVLADVLAWLKGRTPK